MIRPLFRIGAVLNAPSPRPLDTAPPAVIELAQPRRFGGMPLLDALAARHTSREFSDAPVDPDVLGELLWAANGINRDAEGGRTAPSALGGYEIDIYVLLATGTYRYDPDAHRLVLAAPFDLRATTGYQDFLVHAPVDLVFVADLNRMQDVPARQRESFAYASAGAIVQNVYLYCASAGLAVGARGWMNRTALAANLKLPAGSSPLLAQTIGHVAHARSTVQPEQG
ncbi:nitroreductase [Caballeronia calidae]|uniref:Nitroreductase n=1 Tax=Caballeronia calidae TaxID=1777139 RepID=A0A158CXH1_9BURK|nr:nitroreductase family protein [Caballeronia calidae]SAK87048.1 nitroreductase [Caballeronia calidae]